MKRALVILLVIAAVGAGAGAYYMRRNAVEIQVNTAPITRGDIVQTVGSTGTLQAVTTVTVGSQVSGNIAWLGADFNSIVKKGQTIAKLDPSLIQAQLDQTKAALLQQQANLDKAKQDLERMKVQLLDAQQKFKRAQDLMAKQLETQADFDSAKIAVDTAVANQKSQEATVTQSDAAVKASQANVSQQQVNLEHTIITAPIDGIVIQRSVDVGQTVAASMSAPTLFVIAADLTKMQVSANIDESDVGNIRPGQRVTFRVDAYPTDQFEGTVTQIRLQPVVQSNVTTYGTIIAVPNAELKLKPGMTANLKVEIMRRNNVLRVPNAATRFRPTTDMFAALNQEVPPEAQPNAGRGGRGNRGGQGGQGGGQGGGFANNAGTGGNGANANANANAPAAGAPAAAPQGGPGQGNRASGPRGGNQAANADQNGDAGQNGAAADDNGGNRRRGGNFGGGQGRGGFAGGPNGPGGPNGANGQAGGNFGQGRGNNGGGQGFGGRGGNGGGQGQGGFGGGRGMTPDRFAQLTPEQQQQTIDRMKQRGQDTAQFEAMMRGARGGRNANAAPGGGNQRASALLQPKYGDATQGAETIDALFAPLQAPRPTNGRVWLYGADKKLKPITVRLGITDGTNTELVSGDEIQANTEVVTTISGVGQQRVTGFGNNNNNGNPFQQNQRGGGPPGGAFGGPPAGGGGRGR